jgi:rhodanese-related sulfurtransferase
MPMLSEVIAVQLIFRSRALLVSSALVLLVALGGCGGGSSAPRLDVPSYDQDDLWPALFGDARPDVVDIRPAADYDAMHIPYSRNVPGGEGLVAAAQAHPAAAQPLIIVADTEYQAAVVADKIIDAGGSANVLKGGLSAWRHGLDINSDVLRLWRNQKRNIQLVDVRTPQEFAQGHICGSINRPLDQLDSWASELNPAAEYVMICGSGRRSAQARDALAQRGFQRVHNLLGGLQQWPYCTNCG